MCTTSAPSVPSLLQHSRTDCDWQGSLPCYLDVFQILSRGAKGLS